MIIKNIFNFYWDGFSNMTKTSKKLWLIILLKLFIMFAVLKVFFFKNHLNQFTNEEDKIEHISKELTNIE